MFIDCLAVDLFNSVVISYDVFSFGVLLVCCLLVIVVVLLFACFACIVLG